MNVRVGIGLTLLLCLLFPACTKSDSELAAEDPALAQLEVVARHLTSPRHLRNSTYTAVRTSVRPSELVSFLFSDMGVAEWPAATGDDPMAVEQMRATRTPIFPADGALVYAVPDPRSRRQLVLNGDDATGEIVAQAYLDPKQAPLWTHRWPMPELRQGQP